MSELLAVACAAIVPILYMGARKDFFFLRFRKFTGATALCLAVLGAVLLVSQREQRLAYAALAPLGHFLVIMAVEGAFVRFYGRRAAAIYSHPHPPKDRLVDGHAMLVAILVCLLITAATLYLGRKAVGL